MESVDQIENSYDAEPDPHPPIGEKGDRIGSHSDRQLNDGIAQFFVLGPLLAEKNGQGQQNQP